MRRFISYWPVDPDLHYYSPRKELIEKAYTQLLGEDPRKGGHYFTVWAPRQTGKTWVMQETVQKINSSREYEIGILSMERAKNEINEKKFLKILIKKLALSHIKWVKWNLSRLPTINIVMPGGMEWWWLGGLGG